MTNLKTIIAIGLAISCIIAAMCIVCTTTAPHTYTLLFLGYPLIYLLVLLTNWQDTYMKKKRKQAKSIKRTILQCEVTTKDGNLTQLQVTDVDFDKALTTVYAVCQAHHYNLRSVTVVDNQ